MEKIHRVTHTKSLLGKKNNNKWFHTQKDLCVCVLRFCFKKIFFFVFIWFIYCLSVCVCVFWWMIWLIVKSKGEERKKVISCLILFLKEKKPNENTTTKKNLVKSLIRCHHHHSTLWLAFYFFFDCPNRRNHQYIDEWCVCVCKDELDEWIFFSCFCCFVYLHSIND